jgi:hypothetical protein
VSGSRWPEENERCQRSLEQLSSWTLAQDTDKPKFAEHYHGSTDITFPEGTRGKYTRDSMPIGAKQHALHSLPLVPPLCTSTTLTQRANILTAGTAGGTRASSVCALQVYGGGKYWHRSAQASWRRDDGGGRDGGGDADRGRGRNGQTRQTDEYAPRTLRTEPGARSQLRLLTTTERPSSRRWEEGEAAMVQYGSGQGVNARTLSAEKVSVLIPPGGCAAARPPSPTNTNASRAGEDVTQSFGYCGVTHP